MWSCLSGVVWCGVAVHVLAVRVRCRCRMRQAMISGAFSILSQAVAMDCFPRIRILHTSRYARLPACIHSHGMDA